MSVSVQQLVSRIKWRSLGQRVHAEAETVACLERETSLCWNTGSVIGQPLSPTNSANPPPSPEICEFVSLDQFHRPTFARFGEKYGCSFTALCGSFSTAAALILCRLISEKNWWSSALNANQVEELLHRISDPAVMVPAIENVVHFIASLRADYLRSPHCPSSLASSPAQHKSFFADWAANFEISDCIRAVLALDSPQDELIANGRSVFGPTPNTNPAFLPRGLGLKLGPTSLLFLRANLHPIVHTAKYLQRTRIELEDKQFGGRQSGKDTVTYKEGESAFFVDVLASECCSRRTMQRLPTDAAPQVAIFKEASMSVKPSPSVSKTIAANSGRGSTSTAAIPAAVHDVIDVDAIAEDWLVRVTSKPTSARSNNSNNANSSRTATAAAVQPQQQTSTATNSARDRTNAAPAASLTTNPITSCPKFMSPVDLCREIKNRASPLFPPPKGPRVYVVDVSGHYVALLCYFDSSGIPGGVVINSSGGNLASIHKPAVRVAFDLYVANVTAGFAV